jgi:hypothetical protein
MLILFLLLFIWFGSGVVNMGYHYSYFQCEFSLIAKEHRTQDSILAVFSMWLGPIGLIVTAIVLNYSHGWHIPFKPIK